MLDGTVESRRFQAGEIEVVVRLGDARLSCLLKPGEAAPSAGEEVTLAIPHDAVRIVPQERRGITSAAGALG